MMNLLTLFFAGLFFANGIPHFVNGISGRRFHSPFAKPFVKGRSSPFSNVLWGLANFAAALALLRELPELMPGFNSGFIAFVCGFGVAAIGLSILFGNLIDETKKGETN
ncbi:MAG: hypothetical protein JXA21_01490 [Anaerolineae bacterium]|nr:hypothetical protein [Anaerolineae bacterium]